MSFGYNLKEISWSGFAVEIPQNSLVPIRKPSPFLFLKILNDKKIVG